MKKLTLYVFFICISTVSFSNAGFKIGAGVGISAAKIKEKYYSDRNKNMLAFDVAIPMEIKVARYFAIQPEIHFIQKGFGLKYYGVNGVENIYRKRIYIEMPVNFKFVYPIKDKSFINAYIGFGVGYALTNKQLTKYSDGQKKKESFPYDNNVDDDNIAYRRYDLILPIGFGYEYKVSSKVSVYADLRWSLDVNNNIRYKVKPDPTPQYYYRNFIFSMGVNFIAKDK
ncbi:MAG: PorT family protein [Sphingobacteriales bacterium]|nr:PorT family protein [Sphingobacteriales bacterium]